LLAFARPSETHFSPTHLEDVWRLTLNLVGQSFLKYNIQLQVDIPPDLPKVRARTQQLQQVLLNLVTNARDALNEKYPGVHSNKRVSIRARLADDPTCLALLNKERPEKTGDTPDRAG
jgi:C4-dicarboxylate-specific signal transduction histidine kinase